LLAAAADAGDRASPAFQRLTWDALRKSLNGLVNKVWRGEERERRERERRE